MEERVKKLEIITERIARKTSKVKTKAMITPFPISSAVFGEDVRGTILTYLFPCDGKIVKGIVKFGSKPKDEVVIKIEQFNDYDSQSKGYTVNKKNNELGFDLPVLFGDCLKVSVEPKGEIKLTEVWMAFLWEPSINSTVVKQFLLEDSGDISKE